MACNDCPEPDSVNGGLYIVYTGGPPETIYAGVRYAIVPRPGVTTLYGEPQVHGDGEIEYNKNGPKPPVPAGYTCTADDPWKLRPNWISCQHRMLRIYYLEDGSLRIDGLCANPASGQPAHLPLMPDKCNECPVRMAIMNRTAGSQHQGGREA